MNAHRILWTMTAGTALLVACKQVPQESRRDSSSTTTATVVSAAAEVVEDRWEYVTFAPPDIVYDETLNRLGREGWELVSARRVRSSLGDMAYEITMRRKIRPGRPSTTAEEQSAIAIRAMLEKAKLALESSGNTSPKTETTVSAAPAVASPTYRIVGYKEHVEPVYENVAVGAMKYEYHVLQCPSAKQFDRIMKFSIVKAQRIPRAVDCANLPHRIVSTSKWQEAIREEIVTTTN